MKSENNTHPQRGRRGILRPSESQRVLQGTHLYVYKLVKRLWNTEKTIQRCRDDYRTARNRFLLEKLTVPQLVKKFPAFYEAWNFITVFTTAGHFSLFWARLIQFVPSPRHSIKDIFCIMLPFTLRSSKWSLFPRFPNQNPVCNYPHPIRATCPDHLILLDLITQIVRIW